MEDEIIQEEKIYNWILIRKDNNKYVSWGNGTKPPVGEPDLLEWKEWNKPLHEDIDTASYRYENDELIEI